MKVRPTASAWAASRLQLGQPAALLWAAAVSISFAAAVLAGGGHEARFFTPYYLSSLLLFGGVLGGDLARSQRRWLVPARWSPERLLLLAAGPRLVLALGGIGFTAGARVVAGEVAWRDPDHLLGAFAVVLAGAGWVTLLSTFTRGWFDVVGVMALQVTVFWQVVTSPSPELVSGAGWLAGALCPPLALVLLPPPQSALVPGLVAAVLFGLTWWRLRAAEVPA